MTNLEALRTVSKEDVATILCNIVQESSQTDDFCECCVASQFCSYKHKGFIDWLDQENKEGHDGK